MVPATLLEARLLLTDRDMQLRPALGSRVGFTLTEMMLVVVIIGVLSLVTAPRLERELARRSVAAAKVSFSASYRRARAAAVQNRRPTTITIASGLVTVSVSGPGGTTSFVGQSLYYPTLFGVTPTASSGSLTINPTGLVTSGTPFTVALNRGSVYDTVWVTGYGRLE